ncbi:MAG: hypothetical protein EAX86_04775 [Candidatus Heimdallarchaeota archaeon]|nr:hypothetical protein [Candidatus Heimdallarchaeota archaeon]
MIHTKLVIYSKDYYSCELTKKYPVRVTIVSIQLPEGYGYIEALNGNEESIRSYIDAIQKSKDIIKFEITYSSPILYWTRTIHQLDYPSIYETVLNSGNMSILPITISNGLQYHTILSPDRTYLKNLLKLLKVRFTSVKIQSTSSIPFGFQQSLLTVKQLEAFQLAFKSGYYRIPKQIKLTELAPKLGIKRVAMQERLKRAELKILQEFAFQWV